MGKKISLLDLQQPEDQPCLELLRIRNDEIALIPFTAEGESVELHYCKEEEIRSFLHCNGPSCCLCKIGRKLDARILLPVYVPTSGAVAVLAVSRNFRPYALLPQLLAVIKAQRPMVMFVRRENMKFPVTTANLSADMDGGEEQISKHKEQYEAGEIQLAGVIPTIDNDQLSQLPGVARILALKGINRHD